MKFSVIGAGSTYTPEIMDGLLRRKDTLPVDELVLMDIDIRKLNIVGGLVQRMGEHSAPHMKIRMTSDLDDALRGTDFVIGQIRVGKLPARHLDESIPLKHDLIGQETTGIGGFFKALRTIPQMLNVAKRMEALCPDAWLINFSNPSGLIAEALQRYSSARVVGLCNIPINTLRDIRNAVGDEKAAIESIGLNHLSWVTSVISQGRECLPELIEQGYCGEKPANLPKSSFDRECLRACGGIPNSYLVYYYYRDKQLKKLQSAECTRAQTCMGIEEDLLKLYGDTSLYEKPALLDKRGGHLYSEAAVSLAEAIYIDSGAQHTLNTRTLGVLPYLAPDEVGEIACRVDRNGPHPLPVKAQGTPHMIQMIRTVKTYERLAVEAAVFGNRDAAMAAMLSHPLISDFDKAYACFHEMLEAHRPYLPQFF